MMLNFGTQLDIFIDSEECKSDKLHKEWGTFKDSLRAPIHSWFTYPAGFSYKAVEFAFSTYNIRPGHVVYDPFMGSGTTNLVAKTLGINSFGIEAHPFVFFVARTKLNFEICLKTVLSFLNKIVDAVHKMQKSQKKYLQTFLEKEFPELILKCYEHKALYDLYLIRNCIETIRMPQKYRDFLNLGLTFVLREISTAATGWPYIAPKKAKVTSISKNALHTFSSQIQKMVDDVRKVIYIMSKDHSIHCIFNNDSRDTTAHFDDQTVDFVFTSPPYLNNFDYADRTRLEMYFFGYAKNWGEITKNVRDKLMTSATTQIQRSDQKYMISDFLKMDSPKTYDLLKDSVEKLGALRMQKAGRKSYDLMVAGYFNDMYLIIKDVFRVMKHGAHALFVLGDSAPYGVYIPTDELIGQIGADIGFAQYSLKTLRHRGDKWKDNPQRHNVSLRESVVTLFKE